MTFPWLVLARETGTVRTYGDDCDDEANYDTLISKCARQIYVALPSP